MAATFIGVGNAPSTISCRPASGSIRSFPKPSTGTPTGHVYDRGGGGALPTIRFDMNMALVASNTHSLLQYSLLLWMHCTLAYVWICAAFFPFLFVMNS